MRDRMCLPGTTSIPIRSHAGGYVIEGPGFYVWDEDPNEVARVARELARGEYGGRATTRLLVIPPLDREVTR